MNLNPGDLIHHDRRPALYVNLVEQDKLHDWKYAKWHPNSVCGVVLQVYEDGRLRNLRVFVPRIGVCYVNEVYVDLLQSRVP